MNKFKIYPNELNALKALMGAGYVILLTEEASEKEIENDGWRAIWGKEGAKSKHFSTTEEVDEFFSKPFEAVSPKIFCHLLGTHCGGFQFQFGWVHNQKVKKEDLEEAVMPQLRS